MMFDPTYDSTTDHPYRTGLWPFDSDRARVSYDGQTRMRLTISSGLAHARIVIDPAARDLVAIQSSDGQLPRIRLAAGEVALTWRGSFGDWLCSLFRPGLDDLAIVLRPAVEWSLAVRGGLSHVACDLSAGAVARIDIAGGCSEVLFDLPQPAAIVPIRISGGASGIGLRRPADAAVAVGIRAGTSMLQLDDRRFDAIGGTVRLDTGNVVHATPHYELSISGGASDLAIERR